MGVKTKEILKITMVCSLFMMAGCDKQFCSTDGYRPEFVHSEGTETKEVHFFCASRDLTFSKETLEKMNKLLRDTRISGVDNIAFTIISNAQISDVNQKMVKSIIYDAMYTNGFISSRIIDSGVCIYKGAKPGVRIDVLNYSLKEPDCGQWSEYIGDTDTNKNLPKCGFSEVYNLNEMIANKADIVSPRRYKGQLADAAMSAISSSATASSGVSSSTSSGSK